MRKTIKGLLLAAALTILTGSNCQAQLGLGDYWGYAKTLYNFGTQLIGKV
jgi:hypothetical protein